MADYCDVASVRLALNITSDGSIAENSIWSAAGLTDEQIGDAIQEAMVVVDSYVTVDADAVPGRIKYLTRSIAAYYATLSFRVSKDLTDTDPVIRRYNSAMDLLKGLRTGATTPLPPPVGGPDTATDVGAINPYDDNLWSASDWFGRCGNSSPFYPYYDHETGQWIGGY